MSGVTGLVDVDALKHRPAGDAPTLGTDLQAATQQVAARAAAAIAAVPESGPIEVVGEGVLANAVRTARSVSSAEPLVAIIDTTGDSDKIVEALHRLPAGGTLVLAAWPPHPQVNLDPYIDLHRPGVLVRTPQLTDTVIEVDLPEPVAAIAGATLPTGQWFHLT